MKKREAIKQFYESSGMVWVEIDKYVSEHGTLCLPAPDLKYTLKGYAALIEKNKSMYLSKDGLNIYPCDIKGIVDNNGWCKIESKEDLPKEEKHYWVINRKSNTRKVALFRLKYASQYKSLYSHWKPYEMPDKPLY